MTDSDGREPARAYPTAPAIDGVTIRHIVVPDDFVAMNEVANAARFAEGEEFVTSDEQFSEFYSHLSNCDPATDIAIAETRRPHGWLRTDLVVRHPK